MGRIDVASSLTCITGESPLWDPRVARVHWVDIRGPAILSLDPVTGITTRVPVAEEVGFIALTKTPARLVAGIRSGLIVVDLASARSAPLVTVEADKANNRINDGTVAPDGAILFGTMDRDHLAPAGSFWRYGGGKLTSLGGAAIITNGPAISPDGRTALTVDTVQRTITRHHYVDGTFVRDGLFAEFPVGQGVPDGITFDAEGCAWIAHYGGGRISRYQPDGSVERVVTLPVAQVTKCTFGGPDLRTLFVTSAAHRRSLADEPLAGCLLKLPVDVPGVPAHIADV